MNPEKDYKDFTSEEREAFHRGTALLMIVFLLGILLGSCLASGCAIGRYLAYGNDECDYEVFVIRRAPGNCFHKALQIAQVRAAYGRQTAIVFAYAHTAGAWHTYWRTPDGELHDVSNPWRDAEEGTLAAPMFEFDYSPYMEWDGGNCMWLGRAGSKTRVLWIRWELWDSWPRYKVTHGRNHVRILKPSY